MAFLKGKKTYLVALATVAYAFLGLFLGHIDSTVAIEMILGAAGLSALRGGVG